MAKLELYTVTIGGIEHTMQLSPADVERYGDAAVKAPAVDESASASSTRAKATTAANKAAAAENK